MITGILTLVLAIGLLALVLKLAYPLPSRARTVDAAPPLSSGGDLAAAPATDLPADRADRTALHLLPVGIDAFAMRLALVRDARRSVDAQYYIWEDDLSGRLLLKEIIAAADRGVQVRLLVDDNPTAGLDPMWAAANSHPRIAVRLFNPLVIRRWRPLNYLFDFPRLNRRMHNKSLTVDGRFTIVGGRNIGDKYFGAKSRGLFIDLDVLAAGAVVQAVVEDFQRYWDGEAAYATESILAAPQAGDLARLRAPTFSHPALASSYAVAANEALARLQHDTLRASMTWAPVRLVSDSPDKVLDKARRTDLLAAQIAPLIAGAKNRFNLVSGYFVPGKPGTELISGLARRGVRTQVITNSIQVTDVMVVHAGYAPYRSSLLQAGVQLYEARPLGERSVAQRERGPTRFSGGGESVHAKSFSIDGRQLFVGSFNFDPRSALLNCEMGFIIDSPELAQAFDTALDTRVTDAGYRLALAESGSIRWLAPAADGTWQAYDTEPGTTAFGRFVVRLLSKLPIEWLL